MNILSIVGSREIGHTSIIYFLFFKPQLLVK
jgi:hypothetical protein